MAQQYNKEKLIFSRQLCALLQFAVGCVSGMSQPVGARVQLITVFNNALWGDLTAEIWDVEWSGRGNSFCC